MRHALWYGHGSFMGLQIHALPVRIENTFPTITFYSPDYRSTLFRIHICQKVQRTLVRNQKGVVQDCAVVLFGLCEACAAKQAQ